MTTIQINEDESKVQEFLDLAIKKFNFNITVLENSNIKTKVKENKWKEFAKRMSGLTNPKITKHLKNVRADMRENFELRNLSDN